MKIFIYFLSIYFFLFNICYGSWDLVLSEVYLKGNADWIEISNIGDEPFNGTLTLSGATTPGNVPEYFDIENLNIPSGKAIVITRYGINSYDYFQDLGVIGATNSKLVLSATGRDITLWHQGNLLDQFLLPYELVKSNDATRSFGKKEKFGPVSISLENESRNVLSGYIASPGIYFYQNTGSNNFSSTGDQQLPGTGEIQTGQTISTGLPCINDPYKLKISEIYFGDANHDPFIEIQGLSDFEGTITLSGTLLELSFTKQINVIKSGYVIISRGDNGLLSGPDKISEPALKLNSGGGTLFISGQSGQVFDSVEIPPLRDKKVFYSKSKNECQHFVEEGEKFSPGFDERFLFYFGGGNSSSIIITGNCLPCSCSESFSTGNLSSTGTTSNKSDSLTSLNLLQILSLDLTSNSSYQSITIKSNLNSPIIFSSSSPYRLHSTNRTTYNVINGTLNPGETKLFTGNRRFPTSANCIELLSGKEILDKYCYDNINKNTSFTGDTINISSGINVLTSTILLTGTSIFSGFTGVNSISGFAPQNYNIKITFIDYDPKGTDTNNEKIGLILLAGDQIDLKNIKLKIGNTIRKLSGTLIQGQEKIFKGNFGFPNSSKNGEDIFVSLISGDYIFDTYVYNPQKIENGQYLVTSILDGDTIKIQYKDQTKSVRFLGVDAPESNKTRFGKTECLGTQVKKYLTENLKGKKITLELDPTQASLDSYGRILGYVYLDGKNINQEILSLGYAREYTYLLPYQKQKIFLDAQKKAQEQKLGIWNPKLCTQTLLSGDEIFFENATGYVTGEISGELEVKIKNIMPNPKGKDSGYEYITLIFYKKDKSGSGITFQSGIQLSQGRYLLINNKKKKLTGYVEFDKDTILTGKFSFPNKAACVAIGHNDNIFDKLCYDIPKENELIGEGKPILENLSDFDFSLLSQVKFSQIDKRRCITFQGQKLACRNIPPNKTSLRLKNENKLYKNYISLLEGYLKKERKILVQNTKIGEYFSVFKEAKKALKSGKKKIMIGNSLVDVYDLKEQLALKYKLSSVKTFQKIKIPEVLKCYLSFEEERKYKKIYKLIPG